ncbi:hypothetical protein MACK_003890 [Theileria orientalis]|uniref:Uncharacterized protein n=1 Tax=Theileria orientalis TaxID=68886 RepID=A0A976SJ35_THEOR|nr:hypothetical protein MACK_003890 [Theileria orientalis]
MFIKFLDETHDEFIGDGKRLHLKTPKTTSILRLPLIIVLDNNHLLYNC